MMPCVFFLFFQIDDVVDASVVHGLCGLWGIVATALFATEDGYARAYSEVSNGQDLMVRLF